MEGVALPSATVVPNFREKATAEMKARFALLKKGKYIDAYFIFYESDNQLVLTIQEGAGPEKTFVAPFQSRSELKTLKLSDMRAK